METIIEIPSRIIPGAKIGTLSGLGILLSAVGGGAYTNVLNSNSLAEIKSLVTSTTDKLDIANSIVDKQRTGLFNQQQEIGALTVERDRQSSFIGQVRHNNFPTKAFSNGQSAFSSPQQFDRGSKAIERLCKSGVEIYDPAVKAHCEEFKWYYV